MQKLVKMNVYVSLLLHEKLHLTGSPKEKPSNLRFSVVGEFIDGYRKKYGL